MDKNDILQKDFASLTEAEKKILTEAMLGQMDEEWEHRDRGGLYGYSQRHLAYNSNRIEGSTLTLDETTSLFETGEFVSNGVFYRARDIEEMRGHFLMFNHMLQTLREPLSEDLIKKLHYCLEAGVFEFHANGYIPGEYKRRRNTVAGITTSLPENVSADMGKLLDWYARQSVSLEILAEFHARFETIHPFQDGNGRAGRMVLFRECLVNGILPFIIEDHRKSEYYQALREFQNTKGVDALVRYFSSEQKEFYSHMKDFMQEF